jgi:uncharacterized membrane protein SirB2
MNSMLSGGLALLSAIAAVFSFWELQSKGGGQMWLILGIVFLIVTIVFGAMFLTGRVNKTEDIHITE